MNNQYRHHRKRGISGWLSNFSIVSWLITINIIISIIGFIFFSLKKIDYIALKPSNIMQGEYLWTIITHMFVHAGALHLFINMFVLFSLGGLSEKIIGRRRFLWLYIISGLFAGSLSVILSSFYGATELGKRIFGDPTISMVGASGAIFAIAGLFVMLLPKLKFMIIFLPFFSLPAYIMVPLILVVTWLITIAGDFPIGNVAHFGGFLVGIIYGLYLRTKYRKKVKMLQKILR